MAKLFQTLVLLFSLLTLASALASRTTGGDAIKRQTNRKKIIAREAVKRASGIMSVVQEHCHKGPWGHGGHHHPHPSGHSYPKCKDDCGYPGLARYAGWDLKGDDLPGNPVNIGKKGTEETCLEKCYQKSWKGDWKKACVGIEYTPKSTYGKCYLKGLQVDEGEFTDKSYGAKLDGTYLDLIGGCAAWAPYVPKEMDAVCCNSW